ncbi:hypothetical protein Ppb6_02809 [Photorhabdus australis subsp. thailandensis]|uniref:Uncharacterized protein n=1 Tax=Photorhabdus australis subsp. thailandensis TaxID=2805096 RepID=A0A1C0U2A2_9GAMM|nr:hypothetical protein [Photorhabdus australis]OCQ52015.1 hypothetical protein Ppb6_02809 [Photorhabdus australis subsp. thailandensis]
MKTPELFDPAQGAVEKNCLERQFQQLDYVQVLILDENQLSAIIEKCYYTNNKVGDCQTSVEIPVIKNFKIHAGIFKRNGNI